MKLFTILKKDFLLLIRNKAEMAVLFLMPLAFILPISLALGSGDGYGINRNNTMTWLPVANYDQGPRAQELMTSIGEGLLLETEYSPSQIAAAKMEKDPECASPDQALTPTPEMTATVQATPPVTPTSGAVWISRPACVEKVARAMLKRSTRQALLIIPARFSQDVDSGKPTSATLLFDPAGDAILVQQIQGVVKGATIKISVQTQLNNGFKQLNDLVVFAPQNIRQSIDAGAGQKASEEQKPAINLNKVAPENYQLKGTPDTYQQTIPGYTVMYVFFIVTAMAGSIRQERSDGTFRRLLSAPISRAELLGGKLLAALLVGLIQVFLLFLVGALVFQLGLGNDPLAFLFLTVALVFAAAALGLAVSTTPLKGSGLAAPLIIAALLGGCMFPLDLMPPLLRTLSNFVPHSWALRGYLNLMVRGLGLQDVFPQIAALLGFGLLFFIFAIWRFRFED